MDRIKEISNELNEIKQWPSFSSGDTITVTYKIKEGIKKDCNLFRVLFYKEEVQELLKLLLLEKCLAEQESKEFSHWPLHF